MANLVYLRLMLMVPLMIVCVDTSGSTPTVFDAVGVRRWAVSTLSAVATAPLTRLWEMSTPRPSLWGTFAHTSGGTSRLHRGSPTADVSVAPTVALGFGNNAGRTSRLLGRQRESIGMATLNTIANNVVALAIGRFAHTSGGTSRLHRGSPTAHTTVAPTVALGFGNNAGWRSRLRGRQRESPSLYSRRPTGGPLVLFSDGFPDSVENRAQNGEWCRDGIECLAVTNAVPSRGLFRESAPRLQCAA